ncbi:MAG: hypothetical protein U9Q22_03240 [Candidatus Altiarchaeota archaeon]|nr:hypothetical protein [Candidatus Altiarchaeota archaeon]
MPEKDVREIRKITSKAGFKNEEEFVKEAVEEKILEFKKLLFTDITTDVRKGLEKKGVTQEEILRDFDIFRRE